MHGSGAGGTARWRGRRWAGKLWSRVVPRVEVLRPFDEGMCSRERFKLRLGEALCDEPGDVTPDARRRVRWGPLRKCLVRIPGKMDTGAKAAWMRVYNTDNTYKQWGQVWG